MPRFSTREAAKKLGIDHSTLANYLAVGKIPTPETVKHGQRVVHIWTEQEIEHVRQLLPRIANGRKTRYKSKTKAQPKSAVPRKKPSSKKSKPPSG